MNTDGAGKKNNFWMVSTFVLLGVIVGFAASQLPYLKNVRQAAVATIEDSDQAKPAETPESETGPNLTGEQILSLPDDDPFFGQADAPITVVEFSDFQCPFCSKFFNTTFPQIEQNYIEKGKVRFVYRDFPLDFHEQSQMAAEAAQCANDQGKFREMHDAIFSGQQEWASNPDALNVFKNYAKETGLDSGDFNECMNEHKFVAEIRKDLIDGATVGVNGTPAFFINGRGVSGAMPFDIFKSIFDAELEGKRWELQYDATGRPSVKVY